MKLLLVIVLLILVVLVTNYQEEKPKRVKNRDKGPCGPCGRPSCDCKCGSPRRPRSKPVYIDDPTLYLNQPIRYSEWDQEISSSL